MADTSQVEVPPHTNGISEDIDDDERAKMRPADIDADVKEMERRKRVELIMNSKLFRDELERIIEVQLRDGSGTSGLMQQISDMMGVSKNAGNVFKNSNCVVPINDIRGIEAMGYAKGEKILRCKLAAVYRLIDLYGWTQGTSTLITARLNQDEEHFLVNPYGMLFHEITASSLIKADMQGNVVEQGTTNFGVNLSAYSLHAAIHSSRPDIKCIIHVHTPSVVAISALKCGLLPISQESVVIGEVSTHSCIGGFSDPEEKDKITRNLGPNNKVLLLTNQGAVCCGETIEEAFFNARNTVLASESQLKLMPMGVDNLILLTDEQRKKLYDSAHKAPESSPRPDQPSILETKIERKWRVGGVEFEALMRMLDNAGFRTGYIYRHPLVKGDPPRPRSDVEVPPAVSSLGYLLEEEELYKQGLWKKLEGGRKGNDRTRWLNSPNVYQKVEILETGTPDPKKITKWVADGSPTHSSTPVKIEHALQFVPKNTNPKEFKKLQQQIKDYRRADKISAGPQSHILEGVTWEEAKKMQDAGVTQTGDQVVLMGAASKGIIQRGFQHNATMYKSPYAKNPFDSITDEEIDEYKKVVEKKTKGEYDTDFSESEGLSSAQINKRISDIRSPTSAASETEEESRDEPQVLRIETKQAPKPSQPEVVLSDDIASRNLLIAERNSATNSMRSCSVIKLVTCTAKSSYYRTNNFSGFPSGSYAVPNPKHYHIARYTMGVQHLRPRLIKYTNKRNTNNVVIQTNGRSIKVDVSLEALTRLTKTLSLVVCKDAAAQTSYDFTNVTPLLEESGDSEMGSFERSIMKKLHANLMGELSDTIDMSSLDKSTTVSSIEYQSFPEMFNFSMETTHVSTKDCEDKSSQSESEDFETMKSQLRELNFDKLKEQKANISINESVQKLKDQFKEIASEKLDNKENIDGNVEELKLNKMNINIQNEVYKNVENSVLIGDQVGIKSDETNEENITESKNELIDSNLGGRVSNNGGINLCEEKNEDAAVEKVCYKETKECFVIEERTTETSISCYLQQNTLAEEVVNNIDGKNEDAATKEAIAISSLQNENITTKEASVVLDGTCNDDAEETIVNSDKKNKDAVVEEENIFTDVQNEDVREANIFTDELNEDQNIDSEDCQKLESSELEETSEASFKDNGISEDIYTNETNIKLQAENNCGNSVKSEEEQCKIIEEQAIAEKLYSSEEKLMSETSEPEETSKNERTNEDIHAEDTNNKSEAENNSGNSAESEEEQCRIIEEHTAAAKLCSPEDCQKLMTESSELDEIMLIICKDQSINLHEDTQLSMESKEEYLPNKIEEKVIPDESICEGEKTFEITNPQSKENPNEDIKLCTDIENIENYIKDDQRIKVSEEIYKQNSEDGEENLVEATTHDENEKLEEDKDMFEDRKGIKTSDRDNEDQSKMFENETGIEKLERSSEDHIETCEDEKGIKKLEGHDEIEKNKNESLDNVELNKNKSEESKPLDNSGNKQDGKSKKKRNKNRKINENAHSGDAMKVSEVNNKQEPMKKSDKTEKRNKQKKPLHEDDVSSKFDCSKKLQNIDEKNIGVKKADKTNRVDSKNNIGADKISTNAENREKETNVGDVERNIGADGVSNKGEQNKNANNKKTNECDLEKNNKNTNDSTEDKVSKEGSDNFDNNKREQKNTKQSGSNKQFVEKQTNTTYLKPEQSKKKNKRKQKGVKQANLLSVDEIAIEKNICEDQYKKLENTAERDMKKTEINKDSNNQITKNVEERNDEKEPNNNNAEKTKEQSTDITKVTSDDSSFVTIEETFANTSSQHETEIKTSKKVLEEKKTHSDSLSNNVEENNTEKRDAEMLYGGLICTNTPNNSADAHECCKLEKSRRFNHRVKADKKLKQKRIGKKAKRFELNVNIEGVVRLIRKNRDISTSDKENTDFKEYINKKKNRRGELTCNLQNIANIYAKKGEVTGFSYQSEFISEDENAKDCHQEKDQENETESRENNVTETTETCNEICNLEQEMADLITIYLRKSCVRINDNGFIFPELIQDPNFEDLIKKLMLIYQEYLINSYTNDTLKSQLRFSLQEKVLQSLDVNLDPESISDRSFVLTEMLCQILDYLFESFELVDNDNDFDSFEDDLNENQRNHSTPVPEENNCSNEERLLLTSQENIGDLAKLIAEKLYEVQAKEANNNDNIQHEEANNDDNIQHEGINDDNNIKYGEANNNNLQEKPEEIIEDNKSSSKCEEFDETNQESIEKTKDEDCDQNIREKGKDYTSTKEDKSVKCPSETGNELLSTGSEKTDDYRKTQLDIENKTESCKPKISSLTIAEEKEDKTETCSSSNLLKTESKNEDGSKNDFLKSKRDIKTNEKIEDSELNTSKISKPGSHDVGSLKKRYEALSSKKKSNIPRVKKSIDFKEKTTFEDVNSQKPTKLVVQEVDSTKIVGITEEITTRKTIQEVEVDKLSTDEASKPSMINEEITSKKETLKSTGMIAEELGCSAVKSFKADSNDKVVNTSRLIFKKVRSRDNVVEPSKVGDKDEAMKMFEEVKSMDSTVDASKMNLKEVSDKNEVAEPFELVQSKNNSVKSSNMILEEVGGNNEPVKTLCENVQSVDNTVKPSTTYERVKLNCRKEETGSVKKDVATTNSKNLSTRNFLEKPAIKKSMMKPQQSIQRKPHHSKLVKTNESSNKQIKHHPDKKQAVVLKPNVSLKVTSTRHAQCFNLKTSPSCNKKKIRKVSEDKFPHCHTRLSSKPTSSPCEIIEEDVTSFQVRSVTSGNEFYWVSISKSPRASPTPPKRTMFINVDDIPLRPPSDLNATFKIEGENRSLSPITEESNRKLNFDDCCYENVDINEFIIQRNKVKKRLSFNRINTREIVYVEDDCSSKEGNECTLEDAPKNESTSKDTYVLAYDCMKHDYSHTDTTKDFQLDYSSKDIDTSKEALYNDSSIQDTLELDYSSKDAIENDNSMKEGCLSIKVSDLSKDALEIENCTKDSHDERLETPIINFTNVGQSEVQRNIVKNNNATFVNVEHPEINRVVHNEVHFFRSNTVNSTSYIQEENITFNKNTKENNEDWMGYENAKF